MRRASTSIESLMEAFLSQLFPSVPTLSHPSLPQGLRAPFLSFCRARSHYTHGTFDLPVCASRVLAFPARGVLFGGTDSHTLGKHRTQ